MTLKADASERLDKMLARLLPNHSRSKLVSLIEQGLVTVDGKARKASYPMEPGMLIELDEPGEKPAHDLTPSDIPLEVVYEDDVILVVNKPRGLATHPAASLKEPSLVNALLGGDRQLSGFAGAFRPGIVHRLDKDTTGLLVVAKTDAAHASLAKQIERKTADRRYFALVHGLPDQPVFKIDAPIARDPSNRQKMAVAMSGRRAVTHVKFVKRFDAGSLLAVRLETGRTHQIRVHLAAVGHPVVGDRVYGRKSDEGVALQLHAAYLAVTHPFSGARIVCYVDAPEDFLAKTGCHRELIENWK